VPGNIPLVSETTFYTLNTMSALPATMSSFIVSGTGSAFAFAAVTSAAYSGTLTGGTGTSLDINLQYVSGGQIAGNVQSLDETNQVLAQMDSFLSSLANQVNSIQTGTSAYALGATTPSTISFFTLATTSANNVILQVNSALTPQDIAAATGANLPGDNSNALLMVNNVWNGDPTTSTTYGYASLANNQTIPMTSSTNTTFDGMLTSYVSQLGIASAAANSNQQTADALSQQSSSLRQSVSGVDLNEQAAQMVEYQNLYSAAAKFISIVDSMLQTAIDMIS
jgi:flagellar hook-associated protein 1 FlgK